MCSTNPCMNLHFGFTSTEIKNLPRFPRIFIGNWAEACYDCSWPELLLILSCGWLKFPSWLRVMADSNLWLIRVPEAEYKLQLIPSNGCLKSRCLNTSHGWFHFTTDSSSGRRKRVAAYSILRLIRAPATGYELRLIPSCGWLRVATEPVLKLTRVPAAGLT